MLFARFAITRAFLAIFTLILVSLIVFSLMELVPGDCAERYLAFKSSQGSAYAGEAGLLMLFRENSAIVVYYALTSANYWARNSG